MKQTNISIRGICVDPIPNSPKKHKYCIDDSEENSNEITGVKWLKLDADTFYWTVPSANHPDTLKWDSGN